MIKQLWTNVRNSFYNPEFYASIPTVHPRSKAVKFVLSLAFMSTLILVIGFSIVAIPALISFSRSGLVEKNYPDGLVVNIKGGEVTTNVEEPYFIKLPTDVENSGTEDYANLVVIDTTRDLSIDSISEYDSYALLTKDKLVVRKSDAETRILSLDRVGDLTINEENVSRWAAVALKWLKFAILPLALLGLVFGSLLHLVYVLFLSLFFALVPIIVAKIRGQKISYRDAYTISLFAFGPVIVVDIILSLFGVFTMQFGISFLIFLIIIILNIGRGSAPLQTDNLQVK